MSKKPTKPKPPIGRLVYEGDNPSDKNSLCPKCGSSFKRKFLFIKTSRCIQPECSNYWEK